MSPGRGTHHTLRSVQLGTRPKRCSDEPVFNSPEADKGKQRLDSRKQRALVVPRRDLHRQRRI